MVTLRDLLTEQDLFTSRRTWERRLQAIPETLPAQIGCLGRHLICLIQPWLSSGRAVAIDSTTLRARGVWHQKHREHQTKVRKYALSWAFLFAGERREGQLEATLLVLSKDAEAGKGTHQSIERPWVRSGSLRQPLAPLRPILQQVCDAKLRSDVDSLLDLI